MDKEEQPRVYVCPDCGHEIRLSPTNVTGRTRCNPCGKAIIFDIVKLREYLKNYRLENKEKVNSYLRKWAKENPEKRREHDRNTYRNVKKQVKTKLFNDLGGACNLCNESKWDKLVIHHRKALSKTENERRQRKFSLKRYKQYIKEPQETLALVCNGCHGKIHGGSLTLG